MSLPTHRLRLGLAAVVAATVLAAGAAVPAVASSLDEQRAQTESRQRATGAALEDIHDHLEETDAEIAAALADLQAIQAQIPGAQAELAAAEALLAQLQREAAMIAERLVVAQAEEVTITEQIVDDSERAVDIRGAIGQMARDAYKGDMAASALSAVLDAESTEDFVAQSSLASVALRTQTQALRDLEQINGVNRNRQARLTAVREQIVELKAEADAKVEQAEAARVEAEARKVALEQLQAQEQQRLGTIEARRAEQLAHKAELEAQQAALQADLQAIIARQQEERRRQEALEAERRRQAAAAAEAQRRAAAGSSSGGSSGGGSSSGSSAPSAPAPSTSSSSPLGWPSPMNPPVITSHYGWRLHPVLGYSRLHAGTDFRAYCGTPIISSGSGTVEWAYMRGGYGNQVMINHGWVNGASLMTSYNHLTSFAVRAGQSVSKGQVVGYSGTTGTSTACHLHFEVYVNGVPVNPMSWL